MADDQRIYGRGYGKLWPSLLEDARLDWKPRLCFGVMGSFGPAARASLKAVAKRMGVKQTKTVKLAQRLLVETGWLFLVAEGIGRHPRVWYMADRPFDWMTNLDAWQDLKATIEAETARRLVKGKFEGGCGVAPLPKAPLAVAPPSNDPLNKNKDLKQESKTIAADAAAGPAKTLDQKADLDPQPTCAGGAAEIEAAEATGKDLMSARGAILGAFRTWWLAQPWGQGRKFIHAPGDGKLAMALVRAGVKADDLVGPLAAWSDKADEFTRGNGYPFWLFCRAFNALQLAAPGRVCDHPADAIDWGTTYRDGTKAGKCRACGAPVTHKPKEPTHD